MYAPPNVELWVKGCDHQKRLVQALRSGDTEVARCISLSHIQIAQSLMGSQGTQMLKQFISE